MIPKILKGRSFKGATAYLMHDVEDHAASNRVVWTMTRNLATQNPQTAWRVMAATAMDAPRLKKEAGIKATGRKQEFTLKHLVLSWHPDEKDTLTREDMEAAVEGALAALGATERQAIVIAHNDTKHPHVHILINRTLENGKLLDDGKEQEKLQAWARAYERTREQTLCANRDINADARARGEPTDYKKLPRQLVDADKVARRAANDNPDRRTALLEKHAALARAQSARTHALKKRHADQWTQLQEDYLARKAEIAEKARKGKAAVRLMIIERFRPEWRKLKADEQRERQEFARREQSTLGRLSNLFRSVDIGRSALEGDRPSILSQIWGGMRSAEQRQAMLEKLQTKRAHELEIAQKKAIRAAVLPIITEQKLATSTMADTYRNGRLDLAFVQNGERAKLKAEWKHLLDTRATDYAALAASLERSQGFNEKADPVSFLDRMKTRAKEIREITPAREQDNTRDTDRDRD